MPSFFMKHFLSYENSQLIKSISQGAKCAGISAEMPSKKTGYKQQHCCHIQKGIPGYHFMSCQCLKNRFHTCKSGRKKCRCRKKEQNLKCGTDQPDFSLSFFHGFSAFPRASLTALIIPVELKVAPETVSTSVLCSERIELITPFPCERYAESSPGALAT